MGKGLSSGGFQAVLGKRGVCFSPRLVRRTALAAIISLGQAGPIRAQSVPTDRTAHSSGRADPSVRLPPVTVNAKRKRIAKPRPALVVAPAAPMRERTSV